MLKVLIAGANSYIGTSFAKRLRREPEDFAVFELDLLDQAWKDHDFSEYQVVLHVAGMVHKKETKKNRDLFFKVNRDLTSQVAMKAKKSGVRQFIFLSTMSVYGLDAGVIDEETIPGPSTAYGQSKYEAEVLLHAMADETFNVAILRPPMIYGGKCKGNYSKLRKLILKFPFFPKIDNQRSMLYIENLNEFLMHLIDERRGGLFFPQNPDYVSTLNMVNLIAKAHGKRIRTTKLFNPLLTRGKIRTLNKLFGDLVYARSMFPEASRFTVCSFEESIERSEGLPR